MTKQLTLVSHVLCPYVQRAAIVLMEKGVAFDRLDVDLKNKPAWFLAISPLGKTPVLQMDGGAIFESAVICEYLDETIAPRLHPPLALDRARHRSWVEFGSSVLNGITTPAMRQRWPQRHMACAPNSSNLRPSWRAAHSLPGRNSASWMRSSGRSFATLTCSMRLGTLASFTICPKSPLGEAAWHHVSQSAKRFMKTTRSC
jgi:hypothetical protein